MRKSFVFSASQWFGYQSSDRLSTERGRWPKWRMAVGIGRWWLLQWSARVRNGSVNFGDGGPIRDDSSVIESWSSIGGREFGSPKAIGGGIGKVTGQQVSRHLGEDNGVAGGVDSSATTFGYSAARSVRVRDFKTTNFPNLFGHRMLTVHTPSSWRFWPKPKCLFGQPNM